MSIHYAIVAAYDCRQGAVVIEQISLRRYDILGHKDEKKIATAIEACLARSASQYVDIADELPRFSGPITLQHFRPVPFSESLHTHRCCTALLRSECTRMSHLR